jgi:hypothetical protein
MSNGPFGALGGLVRGPARTARKVFRDPALAEAVAREGEATRNEAIHQGNRAIEKTEHHANRAIDQVEHNANRVIDQVAHSANGLREAMFSHIDWLRDDIAGRLVDIARKLTPDEVRELEAYREADKAGRLIKLDYPPSYDLNPRWGYTRPCHEGLTSLFAAQKGEFLAALRDMGKWLPWFQNIKREFSHDTPGEAGWLRGPVNCLDSAALYHLLATRRPRTYLEIGSGLTTMFAARAKRDHNLNTRIISIDPNPRGWVDGLCDEVIRSPFECGDLSLFDALEPGDFVFMDGSHRTFMNSDVTVFMLDVVPKLKPGVIVHIHDIALPEDYPHMFTKWYWSEQYILAAYLLAAGNRIDYILPLWYTARLPEFRAAIAPILNWWGPEEDHTWHHGGSFWFTHR